MYLSGTIRRNARYHSRRKLLNIFSTKEWKKIYKNIYYTNIYMASTRNRNTPNDYAQFIKQNEQYKTWQTYVNGANGFAYDTRLPGTGFNPCQYPRSVLSNNATDIESFLYGINSTNLVNPEPPLVPEFHTLCAINLFKKPDIIMPIPQAIPKYQRPFPI